MASDIVVARATVHSVAAGSVVDGGRALRVGRVDLTVAVVVAPVQAVEHAGRTAILAAVAVVIDTVRRIHPDCVSDSAITLPEHPVVPGITEHQIAAAGAWANSRAADGCHVEERDLPATAIHCPRDAGIVAC